MGNSFGLGLSGIDFSQVPDWQFYGYPDEKSYADFILFQKSYEVDEEEDD